MTSPQESIYSSYYPCISVCMRRPGERVYRLNKVTDFVEKVGTFVPRSLQNLGHICTFEGFVGTLGQVVSLKLCRSAHICSTCREVSVCACACVPILYVCWRVFQHDYHFKHGQDWVRLNVSCLLLWHNITLNKCSAFTVSIQPLWFIEIRKRYSNRPISSLLWG